MQVLQRQVSRPEEQQRQGSDPVSQQQSDCAFNGACGSGLRVHPAEMGSKQPGDDSRTVLAEFPSVGENSRELQHGVPQVLQMEMKDAVHDEKYNWRDEINLGR